MIERRDLLLANCGRRFTLPFWDSPCRSSAASLVAILITYSTFMRRGFYPIIVVSQIVPKISIAPLFIVWFGTGTMSCLARLPHHLLPDDDQFRARLPVHRRGYPPHGADLHGSPWQIFWKIRMPNALPHIFGGMKISITLAIIGVIVSEFVASQQGIGYLIKLASGLLDTPLMMASITVLSSPASCSTASSLLSSGGRSTGSRRAISAATPAGDTHVARSVRSGW